MPVDVNDSLSLLFRASLDLSFSRKHVKVNIYRGFNEKSEVSVRELGSPDSFFLVLPFASFTHSHLSLSISLSLSCLSGVVRMCHLLAAFDFDLPQICSLMSSVLNQ